MTDLKTLQADFIGAVTASRAYRHTPEPQRIDIYRRNLDGGLVGAMEITYPAILALVGEDFFRGSIRQFREDHLPNSTNLDHYGAEYAEFLANFEPAKSLPYLPDIARLEWAYHRAMQADIAPLATLESLPKDPQKLGETRLRPHAATQLITSAYPIFDIWQMQQPDSDPNTTINLDDAAPDFLLITRPEIAPQTTRLSAAEYCFMAELCADKTIFEAYESATATEPTFDLVFCLQKAMFSGSFIKE